MGTRIKIRLAKILYPIWFIYWGYASYLRRLFLQSSVEYIPLEARLHPHQVLSKCSKICWNESPYNVPWKPMSSPHWVQHIITCTDYGCDIPEGGINGSDVALWAVLCMDQSYFPMILCVNWITPRDTIRGCAVCLCRLSTGAYVFTGRWGVSEPFFNLRDGCKQLLKNKEHTQVLGWALLNKCLSLQAYGLGLPNKKMWKP